MRSRGFFDKSDDYLVESRDESSIFVVMSIVLTILAGIVILGLGACNKVEDTFLRFDIDETYELTIPIIPFDSIEAPVPTPDVTNTFDQAFDANSTRADKVRDIRLTKLKFITLNPPGEDFSFMKDVELYLAAQGVETTLMAFRFDIPEDVGSTLELETSGENLDKFKNIGTYNFVVNVVTRAPVDQPINVKADMTFSVTADVF